MALFNSLSGRRSLRANFSWTILGNSVYAASQWGQMVILAKLGTAEMLGQFSLALSLTAPVVMLTNMQLRGVQVTDVNEEHSFKDYLAVRLYSSGVAVVFAGAMSWLGGFGTSTALVIGLVAIAKAVESVSDVFYGLMQKHERLDRVSISLMIRGPVSLAALSVLLFTTGSLAWSVFGLVVTWSLVLLLYDVPMAIATHKETKAGADLSRGHRKSPEAVWGRTRRIALVRSALPLGLVAVLGSLNANIPRYFVEAFQGRVDLGVFSALAYIMVAGSMAVGALGQSASPRLAQYYSVGDARTLRGLLGKMLVLGVGLGLLGVLAAIVFGDTLLRVVYTSEYVQHTTTFVWLMAAAGVAYVASVFGFSMTAARYFTVQLPILLCTVASSTLSGFLLVPRYGLEGAAITVLVSALVQALGSALVTVAALRRLGKDGGH